MTEDLKEFDKLIREKNISDVDTMLEESKKIIEDIPDLQKKHEKIVVARGNVIEASIKMEMAFDELITKTGGEDLLMDPSKEELHLITGVREEDELGGLSFKNKVDILKKILMKIEKEDVYRNYIQSKEWKKKDEEFVNHFQKCVKCGSTENLSSYHTNYQNFGKEEVSDVEVLCWFHQIEKKPEKLELLNIPEPPLLFDLKKIVAIRDIFSHVPINWLSRELEFNDGPRYKKRYFSLNSKWKDVSLAVKDFMNLQEEILKLIESYMRVIVSKREISSRILLGKSYKEILEEAHKSINEEKDKKI